MKKNKILILLLSLSLVIFYSCKNPSGSDDPESPSAPETGAITITAKEGNDFSITESESNGKVVLTAAKGYSDYKWYVDADFTVVSETDTYEFTPSEGCTMVFVTARKDGVEYSATYYVFKK